MGTVPCGSGTSPGLIAARPVLEGHSSGVGRVVFSPDGRTLASAGTDSTFLWDVATREPIGAPLPVAEASGLAFSPNGKLLVVSGESQPRLWSVATSRQLGRSFRGHSGFRFKRRL